MLYEMYQAQDDMMQPYRELARFGRRFLLSLPTNLRDLEALRHLGATWDLIADVRVTHTRPPFALERVNVDGHSVAVQEEAICSTPFGTLLHFRKEGVLRPQPRVLVVSPMAAHFATLLRETIRGLLPDHDVYVTDWHNVRDVPASAGKFDLDDYIDHLIQFVERLGPGMNLMAICQPCPAVLAAVALLSEDNHPATPTTLTLMAGPVDTRQSPTSVNECALSHPLHWFERNVTDRVPRRYPGAGRRVYPGFLQLAGFMSMNLSRHRNSFYKLYRARVAKNDAESAPIKQFYDEYLAVSDLPAEFYLQTLQRVFQEFHLPLGQFRFRDRLVNPGAIRKTALLTVEGGRDDICGLGQTRAAIDLCTGLDASQKAEHLEPEAGHYGTFSGQRWANSIYPRVRDWIAQHAG